MRLLPPLPLIPNWSQPGNAPQQWQQQVAKAVSWLQAWPSDETWTAWLVQPILLAQPLFGHSLSALTGYQPETAVPETEAFDPLAPLSPADYQRSPSAKMPGLKPLSGTIQGSRSGRQTTKQQMTHLSKLPRQADRALLNNWFSGAAREMVASSSGRMAKETAATRKNGGAPPPDASQSMNTTYFQAVAQKIDRMLPDFAKPEFRTKKTNVAPTSQSGKPTAVWPAPQAIVAMPWAAPIAGPEASFALLNKLLFQAAGNNHRAVPPPAARQPAAQTAFAANDEGLTSRQIGEATSRQDPTSKLVTFSSGDGNNLVPGLPQTTSSRSERVRPPQKAETLPLLEPTPDMPEAPFSPATAVFERRQKKAELPELTETELQYRIKRILDDEARRFGIDV
ncbi:MAG: hypothetical protein H6656_00645 [Ardenticatenaceae bacterium]|nr:hypothetical protein [Anaerolineales bacterium]MCB9005892.1 hypothetical protein [Ardenticatenaceae bacterium]